MMNYQYIEQLLDKYWDAETTLEEEQILKSFFQQDNVPELLQPYKTLFCLSSEKATLSDDFDRRMELLIADESKAEKQTKAIVIPFSKRLMPLLKAAAVVAVTLTVGGAALKGMMQDNEGFNDFNLTSGTYVQTEDVKNVLEVAQKSMTAKADSISIQVQDVSQPEDRP